MKPRRDDGPSLRGPIVCCLLAVVALSLGPTGEASVRATVRDAARPGFLLARALDRYRSSIDPRRWPWTGDPAAVAGKSADRPPTDHRLVSEVRRLRAEVASARRDLEVFEASLGPIGRTSDGSSGVERIPARVLDASAASAGPGGMVIEGGAARGIEVGQPAVAVTLAVGEEQGVAGDSVVLAGAAVLGRTDQVGAWVSTIIPVTAPAFRAHVRIVRETAEGPAFGEEGLLEGDGRDGCLVKYVPSTSPVSVGDHVYSHDPSGRIPQPLYFGRIEAASLPDGAPHWEIKVRPAAEFGTTSEVHVLRAKPHPTVQTAASR